MLAKQEDTGLVEEGRTEGSSLLSNSDLPLVLRHEAKAGDVPMMVVVQVSSLRHHRLNARLV
jgi:hypothetical protein